MISKASIFDHDGVAVRLGEKLGTGGEGSVFAVPARGRDLVAKLYHQPLPAERHAKLFTMVACCNDALREISAWPVALLHTGRKGPVRGFLMPRLFEHDAVHNVYGPAHRKAKYPRADWAFLVQVARNLAAAFDTIHCHGHVIGDVNQGNVFVAANALIKLIDCDSFQIRVDSAQFACNVGVPHFTAPELQRAHSFRALRRTVHHDNFGLAVLVFHLLFMGRHPFAGVYSGRAEMPIERAIKEFRYVFARNAATWGMSRPPGSIGPEIVTAELSDLFEQAFRKGSDPIERPQARRWLQALDGLQREIHTCGAGSMHRYYGKLPACPWCDLESRAGLVFFVGSVAVVVADPASFSLPAAWRRIEAVSMPLQPLAVAPSAMMVTPTPLPQAVKIGAIWKRIGAVAIIAMVAVLSRFAVPLVPLWSMLGLWCWRTVSRNTSALDDERNRRVTDHRIAERRWHEVEEKWEVLSGRAAFNQKLGELSAAKHEYERLEVGYRLATQRLEDTVRERQLQKFLSQFHIDDAAIANLGVGRRATLASFGIETAADVERGRILQLRGFGEALTNELLAWRRGLEAQFRFDAARAMDPLDVQALARRFTKRRADLAAVLSAGPQELQRIGVRYEQQRRAFLPSAEEAARALAQANANLLVL